jgi:hypothetical protein
MRPLTPEEETKVRAIMAEERLQHLSHNHRLYTAVYRVRKATGTGLGVTKRPGMGRYSRKRRNV